MNNPAQWTLHVGWLLLSVWLVALDTDVVHYIEKGTGMGSSRNVQLALVQMSCVLDKHRNIEKALDRIAQAAKQGANIVCLQEVFNTTYPCQLEDHAHFDLAEEIPGITSTQLQRAAKQHGIVITCSIFERRAPGLYHNTAVTFDTTGEMVGKYRKMHIPDDPLYYEKFYFTPGDLGFSVAKTKFACLGIGVCWDQWYPEAARLFALRGAEILLYPTAIGWIPSERQEFGSIQHSSWETSMRAHAIANGVYVGATNRVGTESRLQFWGASFVADPSGSILQRASHDTEEVLIVACDLGKIDVTRTHWPFLRDRRIDAYGDITKRYIDV
jgi:N-carbamoylputrescine amidase